MCSLLTHFRTKRDIARVVGQMTATTLVAAIALVMAVVLPVISLLVATSRRLVLSRLTKPPRRERRPTRKRRSATVIACNDLLEVCRTIRAVCETSLK